VEKTNVVLIGMPGSGKSTVGVILAKELCMDFLDTDVLMQRSMNMPLQDIYDRYGVDGFLAIEARTVMGLGVENTVVAPGGSVVLNPAVMASLGDAGEIVFLDVPIDIITRRIDLLSRGTVRAPGETIEDVWRFREPLYRRYAGITIPCGTMNQNEIARRIVSGLKG